MTINGKEVPRRSLLGTTQDITLLEVLKLFGGRWWDFT